MEFAAQAGREVSRKGELSPAEETSDEVDLADGLQRLSALVSGGKSLDELLAEVAGFAAHAIPDVDGAGVTVIRPMGNTMGIGAWAATKPFVRQIDIWQYETLQEGPCITCMQDRVAVISGSLGGDRRWPRFGDRVRQLGVSSSMSLPLLIADQVVGSINCYAYDTDAFGEHAVQLGSQFAGPAAVSVYNAQLIARTRERTEELQRALIGRAVIDQAIGILLDVSGGTAEQALDRLRRISQAEGAELHVVAQRTIDGAVRRARARAHE